MVTDNQYFTNWGVPIECRKLFLPKRVSGKEEKERKERKEGKK